MNLGALPRTATLAIILAAGMTTSGAAQRADTEENPYGMMEGMGGEKTEMHGHRGMMRPHIMGKIMFAIADTNGDGALSFDEVSAIHKRVFDAADANKDGKLTREEIQAFIRGE
jgi:hypothetical protein